MITRPLIRQSDRVLVKTTLIFVVIGQRKNDGFIRYGFLIKGCVRLSRFGDSVEVAKLNAKHSGLHVGEAPVVSDSFMPVGIDHSMVSKEANSLTNGRIVGRDKPTFTTRNIFASIERK